MQQVYAFHEVFHPGIFAGDLITASMMGYLAPLHYYLGYALTWLTKDPIMMSHWVMFIQLSLTLLFIFLTVFRAAGMFPACFAGIWFLHSRHLIQRLTGGLPRGWMAPLIAIYFYCILNRHDKTIIVLLIVATLLNPLSAFLLTMTYGFSLLWRFAKKSTRASARMPLVYFLFACPIIAGTTLLTTKRPPEIGKMVTYEEALKMPEFSKLKGRFQLVPFNSPTTEIKQYSAQVFQADFYKGPKWLKRNVYWFILGILSLLLLLGVIKKRAVIPSDLLIFLFSTLIAYSAARFFAFGLYIPGRYLRMPLGLFLITAISIGVWKAFELVLPSFKMSHRDALTEMRTEIQTRWVSMAMYLFIAVLIFIGSGDGFQKQANFNYQVGQDGHVFEWIRKYSISDAVVAGDPRFVNPVPLFSLRRVYASNETTHPFYDQYYAWIKRRVEISLRAHYARSLEDFLKVVEGEKIDYFIFERKRFYPEELKKATYFAPLDVLMKELTTPPDDHFAFKQLPEDVDLEKAPYMPFRDQFSALIDVKKLKETLHPNPQNLMSGEAIKAQ